MFKLWSLVVLEKTLESPLDYKEIQLVHSKGDQSWVFFGRNDVKAETPILWPSDGKSWLIGKDYDAGRSWGQEEKGTTEDDTAGWHHRLDGCEFEWTPGTGDGQGGLTCCNSWGHKESDTTEQLNWTDHSTRARPLECEVKWALGSITMNKANEGDGIPVELFQILKKWCCESAALNMPEIWKTQQWP